MISTNESNFSSAAGIWSLLMENWHIIENDSGSQWQTHELKPYNFAALFWGSTRIHTTGGKINKTMHIMIWLIWPYKTNKLACRHSNAPFWPAVAHIKLPGLLEILILGTINVDFTRWELVPRHEIYMCFEIEK